MKKIIQLVLLCAVCGLGYWLYEIIMTPVRFDEVKSYREEQVIERLKDVRKAQRAFKTTYGHYTASFDSLINFVANDSLKFEIKFGSEDDSAAVAQGKVKTDTILVAVLDTIFNKSYDPAQLRYIPFSNETELIMDAAQITTESKMVIPVFEAKAPYKTYLSDLDNQLLINLIDQAKTVERYPGLKVGSVTSATNDAGNWE